MDLTADGFALTLRVPFLNEEARATVAFGHQPAKKPQADNIVKQLSKLGATPYTCQGVSILNHADRHFIPSSLLSDLRREGVEALDALIRKHVEQAGRLTELPPMAPAVARAWQPEYKQHPYLYNISNSMARSFYEAHGLTNIRPAFEVGGGGAEAPLLMRCRHCIRFALGHCVRRGGEQPTWREPLTLRLGDGRRFRLEFDCKACQMAIYGL